MPSNMLCPALRYLAAQVSIASARVVLMAGESSHVPSTSSLVGMSGSSRSFDAEVADHQVIFRAGRVEAVVVPLEEYRAQGAGAA
jgi:hypothetical protein